MRYQCPNCRTSNIIHKENCRWSGLDIHTIEKAHTDIASTLTMGGPKTKYDLRDESHGQWLEIHDAVFDRLQSDGWLEVIGQTEQDGEERDVFRILTPDEQAEHSLVPDHEHLQTIHNHGAVDGCLDNGIIAMIAYWEMVGFSWEQTREAALDWLNETGTWERGSFDESSPEELVDSKRHVYENSYGWKTAAQEAATVLNRRMDRQEGTA